MICTSDKKDEVQNYSFNDALNKVKEFLRGVSSENEDRDDYKEITLTISVKSLYFHV